MNKYFIKNCIILITFLFFSSCARKYDILKTGNTKNKDNKKIGEVIFSNNADRILCYSTIIFYGGYCWLIGYGESNLNNINEVKQFVYDEKKLDEIILKRSKNKIFMDFKNKISLIDYKLASKEKNNNNLDYFESNAVVLPIVTLGTITVTQKTIIYNELFDVITQDFNVVSQEEYEKAENRAFEELDYEQCTEDQCIKLIQEILQVENMFQLQMELVLQHVFLQEQIGGIILKILG